MKFREFRAFSGRLIVYLFSCKKASKNPHFYS